MLIYPIITDGKPFLKETDEIFGDTKIVNNPDFVYESSRMWNPVFNEAPQKVLDGGIEVYDPGMDYANMYSNTSVASRPDGSPGGVAYIKFNLKTQVTLTKWGVYMFGQSNNVTNGGHSTLYYSPDSGTTWTSVVDWNTWDNSAEEPYPIGPPYYVQYTERTFIPTTSQFWKFEVGVGTVNVLFLSEVAMYQ